MTPETVGFIRGTKCSIGEVPAVTNMVFDKEGMLCVTEGAHGGQEWLIPLGDFKPSRDAFFSLGSSAGVPQWIDGTATVEAYHHEHFAECPKCKEENRDYSKRDVGMYNVGRGHWYYCKPHKLTWCVGSNLFSSWRDQTEEQQRAIYDALGMESFEVVDANTGTPKPEPLTDEDFPFELTNLKRNDCASQLGCLDWELCYRSDGEHRPVSSGDEGHGKEAFSAA